MPQELSDWFQPFHKTSHIVQEQDIIDGLRRWKKPRIKVQVADETSYYTSLLFADGTQLGAAAHISDDLATGFYRLAGKYATTLSENKVTQINMTEE